MSSEPSPWFDRARLGVFIHWGAPSARGLELSWPMVGGAPFLKACQSVSLADYEDTLSEFRPNADQARSWAAHAVKLGAQYAVFTAKHHDGFAMFDTRLSKRSVRHTGIGRDVVREYVDAFRGAGLKVGLYFSLSDWSHPDYPAMRESDRPYDFLRLPQPTPDGWERYLRFLFGQVEELLTRYGTIDVLWFDGQWERMLGDAWRAAELRRLIKGLQPHVLINDRLPGQGDFETPEQFVPATAATGPERRAWETCLTMNESWGFNPQDTLYKSAHELVQTLCEVAGRGGNLLLNLSPRGDGSLPPEQIVRLTQLSEWMSKHSEAIVGTEPGLAPYQFYGPSTRRGHTYYLCLPYVPYESVSVRNVPIKRVRNVRRLSDAKPLEHSTRCSIIDGLYNPDPLGELTIRLKADEADPLATVIAFEIDAA